MHSSSVELGQGLSFASVQTQKPANVKLNVFNPITLAINETSVSCMICQLSNFTDWNRLIKIYTFSCLLSRVLMLDVDYVKHNIQIRY